MYHVHIIKANILSKNFIIKCLKKPEVINCIIADFICMYSYATLKPMTDLHKKRNFMWDKHEINLKAILS
jgi:hypothetical protein